MNAVNNHGYKMAGLRAAASETKSVNPRMGGFVQIGYNKSTGEIVANYVVSGSYVKYEDVDVLTVCNATAPMTMQAIADAIRDAVAHDEAVRYAVSRA